MWWKSCTHHYINSEDTDLWNILLYGPYIPTKKVKDGDLTSTMEKTIKDYIEVDRQKIEKIIKSKDS